MSYYNRRATSVSEAAAACESREDTLQLIASTVSSTLMPMFDRMERELDEDGWKRTCEGSFETFEAYWESEIAEDHRYGCEDADDPEDEYRKECEERWGRSRETWLKETKETFEQVESIVSSLAGAAERFGIPFDPELIKLQARTFAAQHTKWDSSNCW